MKVVCDNCSAVYKVPADKLTKAVNKATCRNCGHRMLIPRPQPDADPDEQTVVTAVPPTPNVSLARESSPRRAAALAAAVRSGSPAAAAVAAAASARAAVQASTTRDDVPLATPMPFDRAASAADRAADRAAPVMERAPVTDRASAERVASAADRAALAARARLTSRASEQDMRPQATFPAPQPTVPAPLPPRPPPSFQDDRARTAPHRVPTPPTAIDRRASPNAHMVAATGWGPGAKRTPTPPGSSPPAAERVAGGVPPSPRAPASLPPRAPPQHQPPPARNTPAGGARHTPTPLSARVHDPGRDLSLAVASTWSGLVGSIVLAFLFVLDQPIFLWVGLALSLGSGAFTLLVLTTGNRGRRPARVYAAAGIATLVAVGAPATLMGASWFVDQARAAYALNFGDGTEALVGQDQVAASSIAPATPPEPEGLAVAEPVVEPDLESSAGRPSGLAAELEPAPEVVAEPEPVKAPPKPSSSRTTSAPKPAPSPRSKPAPAKPAPAAAAPAEAPLETVPVEAIHVMLSSNVDVKRCFVPLLQAGNLPPRVDVRFDIAASGAATNLHVLQADQQGTELERCLARTVGNIQFPATSGKGTTITYPFILQ